MARLLQDLQFGLRVLRKRWAFTTLALVSLALGIAANTIIFSLINEVFLQPLPIEDADRVVSISTVDDRAARGAPLSHLNWLDVREQNETLAGVAGYGFSGFSVATGPGEPTIRTGLLVSGNYFEVLGVRPARGRFFTPEEDDAPGAHPVVVLHHRFWSDELGAADDAVGSTIRINRQPFTVIGVAPAGFDGLNIGFEPAAWVPMAMNRVIQPDKELNWYDQRRGLFLFAFGRLAPGVGIEQAAANLDLIAKRLEQAYPDDNQGRGLGVRPIAETTLFNRDATARSSALLMAAVAIVLLIACANVASLLLAQASERRKEIALRLALGVRRGRLIRQLLTESLLLAGTGGALGGALAAIAKDPVSRSLGALPGGGNLALDLSLDGTVLLFALVLSLATGVLFGLWPALQASRPELVGALKNATDTALAPGRKLTAQRALVIGQLALAVVSLVAAALFVRSLGAALDLDLGYRTHELVALGFDVGRAGYSPEEGEQFFRRAEEAIAAVPGVARVALAQAAPLQGSIRRSVILEGENPEQRTYVQVNVVGSGYFETAGVPLEQGRGISEHDRAGQVPVVVVNRTMAKKYWPGTNAVGKRFSFFGMDPVEVIGIAADAKYNNPGEDPQPYAYLPLLQQYVTGMNILARAEGNPEAVLRAAQTRLRSLDPDLVIRARTVSGAVSASLQGQQMSAVMLGSFGGIALVLATIGIYGIMAFAVRSRRREIGIRMALGAQASSVVGLVLRDGFKLAIIGLAAGVLASLALTRFAGELLYVSPSDPVAILGTVGLLLCVAVVACFVPSCRAAKVHPIEVLRAD